MPGDVVLSRELKSLQEEISASQKERVVASTAASPAPPSAAEPAEETPDAGELRDQLRELASEVSGFFEEAEKGISAQKLLIPAALSMLKGFRSKKKHA